MRSIVINDCFGGFSLSHAGMLRYAEIKGIALYPELNNQFKGTLLPTYWLVPPENRVKELDGPWMSHSQKERGAYNKAYDKQTIHSRNIPRDDPALVKVVRELGQAAAGRCAHLKIVRIPNDVNWEIKEYDGNEHIAEVHRTWE